MSKPTRESIGGADVKPCACAGAPRPAKTDKRRAVYGPDNRVDLYQVTDPVVLARAAGTLLIVDEDNLTLAPDGSYQLQTQTLEQAFDLCPDQTFGTQPVPLPLAGVGSAFFVTETCVATAGHCIVGRDTTRLRLLLGYQMTSPTQAVLTFPPSQVFKVSKVIRALQESNSKGADYAIVQVEPLDTCPPPSVLPLSDGRVLNDDAVCVIGYPSGLPCKYAPDAWVRDDAPRSYFVANLDTFGGNSGSPVFDASGNVVGILVRGGPDYTCTSPEGCHIACEYPDTGGRGEDVQRMDGVIGPLRQVVLRLNIGNNGKLAGRKVYAAFCKGPLRLLSEHGFDANKSYEFAFDDPAALGLSDIDSIRFVEIYSPATNTVAKDDWSLASADVLVNGRQLLYQCPANHTFRDANDSPSQTWKSTEFMPVDGDYVVQSSSGYAGAVTVLAASPIMVFGMSGTAHVLEYWQDTKSRWEWTDWGPAPAEMTAGGIAGPLAAMWENPSSYGLFGVGRNGHVIRDSVGMPAGETWTDFGSVPAGMGGGGVRAALACAPDTTSPVFGVGLDGEVLQLCWSHAPVEWYSLGRIPAEYGADIVDGLAATSWNGTIVLFCTSDKGVLLMGTVPSPGVVTWAACQPAPDSIGGFDGPLAAVAIADDIRVFGTGAAGNVIMLSVAGGGSKQTWTNLGTPPPEYGGGSMAGPVGAAVSSDGSIQVFGLGASGDLLQLTGSKLGWSWVDHGRYIAPPTAQSATRDDRAQAVLTAATQA